MAFAIPALNDLVYRMKNHADRAACPGRAAPYVLIVTPTNLLAKQTVEVLKMFISQLVAGFDAETRETATQFLQVAAIAGYVPMAQQEREIDANPSIIVATPGRLRHMIYMNRIVPDRMDTYVLDEADQFIKAIHDETRWPEFEGPDGINQFIPSTTATRNVRRVFLTSITGVSLRDTEGKWLSTPRHRRLKSGKDQLEFVEVDHHVLQVEDAPGISSDYRDPHAMSTFFKIWEILSLMSSSDTDMNAVVVFANTIADVDSFEKMFALGGNVQLDNHGHVVVGGQRFRLTDEQLVQRPLGSLRSTAVARES